MQSGEPFFVRVRDEVLAVDFDKPTAEAAANRLYWTCRMLGLPALLVASGQPGRRHVFAWPQAASQRAALDSAAREDEGDIRSTIRPPMAPHRMQALGVRPVILRGLDGLPSASASATPSARSWRPKTIEAAIYGNSAASTQTRTRSQVVYSVAMAACNANWSIQEALDFLRAPGSAAARAFAGRCRDRGQEATTRWFTDSVWVSAEEKVRENPARRQDTDPLLNDLSACVERLPWPGRSGPSARAAYIGLLSRARELGTLEIACSHRKLMEQAGISSRKTIQTALKRLEAWGLIEWIGTAKRSELAENAPPRHHLTYRWRLCTSHLSGSDLNAAAGDSITSTAALGHDAFLNRSGLGKNAHRIWVAVEAAPGSTPEELSQRLEIGKRTVRKHLAEAAQDGAG